MQGQFAFVSTHLSHESRNDTMKVRALVVQLLSRLADSLFSCAQGFEICSRLGVDVFKEFDYNFARLFATNLNFQKDTRVGVVCGVLSVQFVPLGDGSAAAKKRKM